MNTNSEQLADLQIQQAKNLDKLAQTMTYGIRRWEKVIYPMMVAFIVLAIYGFYLIYNVTRDMNQITQNMTAMTGAVVDITKTLDQKMNQIDHQMGAINIHMDKMNQNIRAVPNLDKNIAQITSSIQELNQHILTMSDNMHQVNQSMTQMNQSVYSLNHAATRMSGNLGELNRNISVPMGTFNSMMPWSFMQNNQRPTPNYYAPAPQVPGAQPQSSAQESQ
ncbi:hypothetical protein THMIRHAS_05720 [Thiosulfatimonas sediminis]|uniref:Uncharacterized protein n=1 Tax=Thiosulfatimonas sediminis TaxID=2675054 RepID=A0A6F8PSW5_9GAMM|nr:DUF948 domain-containing protein [Thiosulfatimonas sediminis]BBP45199.1 hypothetical protein THMIRHAS_05720 [Thiosulfatimonas sediminis]